MLAFNVQALYVIRRDDGQTTELKKMQKNLTAGSQRCYILICMLLMLMFRFVYSHV